MPSKGRELEKLVELLERTWADNNLVAIQSPLRLRDKETGRLREHDVVLKIKHQHHALTIAFECRDRSRKVTVEQVEAFSKKCFATGVDQGVIVSTKGFFETARRKSALYGIRCLDLAQAASFDWFGAEGMEQQTTNVTRVACTCIPIDPDIKLSPKRFTLLDPNRSPAPPTVIYANIQPLIERVTPRGTKSGTYTHKARFDAPNWSIRDDDTGLEVPIRAIIAEFDLAVTVKVVPFRLLSYADKTHQTEISQVATIPIGTAGGPFEGDLFLVHKPGAETKVIYTRKNGARSRASKN